MAHKYQAVIFDLDDTLVKSREAKWAHHKAAAKKFFDIDIADEEMGKHWGKPFDEMVGHLYRNVDSREQVHTAIAHFKHDFPKLLYPDTIDTVNKLLSMGIQVGVLTSSLKGHVTDDLGRLGVPYERFLCINGSEESAYHKPDPRVFEATIEALGRIGIKKEETAYVGDSLADMFAARDAGLGFIAVTRGLVSKEEFERQGAQYIVADLHEILPIIK